MCPQGGVLLSLGVDVYVSGNPTWMGLCVHACIPVFVLVRAEVCECASGFLCFSARLFRFLLVQKKNAVVWALCAGV